MLKVHGLKVESDLCETMVSVCLDDDVIIVLDAALTNEGCSSGCCILIQAHLVDFI